MFDLRRAAAAAALSALLLTAGACSSSDDSADDTSTDAPSEDTTADGGGDAGDPGSGASGDSDSTSPCDAVTQEQWEAIFGEGVTKGDAGGGADNCNVLTSGSSPGHEIALSNLVNVGTTTFEEGLTYLGGCSGEPTELDLADQAVVDTSCLEISGSAFVLAQDGDAILLVSLDLGQAATDGAAVGEAFTEVATDVVSAR